MEKLETVLGEYSGEVLRQAMDNVETWFAVAFDAHVATLGTAAPTLADSRELLLGMLADTVEDAVVESTTPTTRA